MSRSVDKNFFSVPGIIDDPYQTKYYNTNNNDLDMVDGKRILCDRIIKSYKLKPEKTRNESPLRGSSSESFN